MMERHNQQVPVAAECVPNIGAKGQARRLVGGTVWTGVTLAVFAVLVGRAATTPLFLVVAPFAGLAAVNFFQVKEKT